MSTAGRSSLPASSPAADGAARSCRGAQQNGSRCTTSSFEHSQYCRLDTPCMAAAWTAATGERPPGTWCCYCVPFDNTAAGDRWCTSKTAASAVAFFQATAPEAYGQWTAACDVPRLPPFRLPRPPGLAHFCPVTGRAPPTNCIIHSSSGALDAETGGLPRTRRRRLLRQAHGDRLRKALYMVDLQFRGIRGALRNLEAQVAAPSPPSWSRSLLLQARTQQACLEAASSAETPVPPPLTVPITPVNFAAATTDSIGAPSDCSHVPEQVERKPLPLDSASRVPDSVHEEPSPLDSASFVPNSAHEDPLPVNSASNVLDSVHEVQLTINTVSLAPDRVHDEPLHCSKLCYEEPLPLDTASLVLDSVHKEQLPLDSALHVTGFFPEQPWPLYSALHVHQQAEREYLLLDSVLLVPDSVHGEPLPLDSASASRVPDTAPREPLTLDSALHVPNSFCDGPLPLDSALRVPSHDREEPLPLDSASHVHNHVREEPLPMDSASHVPNSACKEPLPLDSAENVPNHVCEEPLPSDSASHVPIHVCEEPLPLDSALHVINSVGEEPSPLEKASLVPDSVCKEPLPLDSDLHVPNQVCEEPLPLDSASRMSIHVCEEPLPVDSASQVPNSVVEEPLPLDSASQVPTHVCEEPLPYDLALQEPLPLDSASHGPNSPPDPAWQEIARLIAVRNQWNVNLQTAPTIPVVLQSFGCSGVAKAVLQLTQATHFYYTEPDAAVQDDTVEYGWDPLDLCHPAFYDPRAVQWTEPSTGWSETGRQVIDHCSELRRVVLCGNPRTELLLQSTKAVLNAEALLWRHLAGWARASGQELQGCLLDLRRAISHLPPELRPDYDDSDTEGSTC